MRFLLARQTMSNCRHNGISKEIFLYFLSNNYYKEVRALHTRYFMNKFFKASFLKEDAAPSKGVSRRLFLQGLSLVTCYGIATRAIPAWAREETTPKIEKYEYMSGLYFPQEIIKDGVYVLPELPYGYDALEPFIDEATLRLHHDKHHAAYVAGANAALAKLAAIAEGKEDITLSTHWVRQLAFHESGHILHSILWNNMTPNPKGAPEGDLLELINKSFGSYENFVRLYKAVATGVEGSGWGILGYDSSSKALRVLGIEKHQNLTTSGLIPLLVLDVWEHAYYLKHQNNRAGHVEDFLKVVNWDDVATRLEKTRGKCKHAH